MGIITVSKGDILDSYDDQYYSGAPTWCPTHFPLFPSKIKSPGYYKMKITVRKDLKRKTSKHRKNYGVAKKKTAAYAPGKKKAFKRMSNPLAENKQITGAEISATVGVNTDTVPIPILTDYSVPPVDTYGTPTGAGGHAMTTSHWHFNPDSALYQTQGLDESQMVGRSVYQTLTAAKLLIKWPQSTMDTGITQDGTKVMGVIPEQPMSYKLYWGTVPLKYLFTGETDPKANEVSAFQLEQLVNQRVSDYFNARQDRVQFIPKKTATINIEGSKVLHPQWGSSTGRLPVSGFGSAPLKDYDGSIPDTLVKIKWNTNRKIHFEPTNKFGYRFNESSPGAGPIGPTPPANGATVFYRNYSGKIPFAVIVSWNHDKLPPNSGTTDNAHDRTRRCPQILVNDITYYRDS